MALQFCDGFDSFGSAGDLMGKWSSYAYNSGPSDLVYLPAGGRFGGGALRIANSSSYVRKKLATPVDELFVNAAVFPRAWPTSTASSARWQRPTTRTVCRANSCAGGKRSQWSAGRLQVGKAGCTAHRGAATPADRHGCDSLY